MTTAEKETVVMRADWVPGPKQGHWTYNHYAALTDDGRRYEIVDGVLFMTPSPSEHHQQSVGWFFHYLLTYVQIAGFGRVYVAPFDVELAPDTVVQPDVVVVLKANIHKIVPSRIIGGPDLVVEVSSPGTVGHDRRKKQEAYARAGVREYWLADPAAHTVEVLVLEGTVYHSIRVFAGKETLISQVAPGIEAVRIEQFFL